MKDNATPVALTTVCLADYEDNPAPPRKWIVRDMIPDRNITDLAGDGGLGKSLVALQLAVAMASATDWIGVMPEPGRVLYLSAEDELDEIRRRVESIAEAVQLPFSRLADFFVADMTTIDGVELAGLDKRLGKLSLAPLYHRVATTIDALTPRLTILDTRADFFGGSEIDRAQVRAFIHALRRLCIDHNTAILMLSHPSLTGMNTSSGQSGSTAWGNSVRSRLYLERPKLDTETDPDLRILSSKKSNYSGTDLSITLRWSKGMFRPEGGGASGYDKASQNKVMEDKFLQMLRDFNRQGRHVNNAGGPYYAPKMFAEADGKISRSNFRAAMERLFADGKLKIIPEGPKSRGTNKIVEVDNLNP